MVLQPFIFRLQVSTCCLQDTHFRPKDTSSRKMKWQRTVYHSNGPQNKTGVAILISNKLEFIPKAVIRDEEGHSSILKGSIQQEDLTVMTIYALLVGDTEYINLLITKIKRYLDDNTLKVGDFNMANDRFSKQIITKKKQGP